MYGHGHGAALGLLALPPAAAGFGQVDHGDDIALAGLRQQHVGQLVFKGGIAPRQCFLDLGLALPAKAESIAAHPQGLGNAGGAVPDLGHALHHL